MSDLNYPTRGRITVEGIEEQESQASTPKYSSPFDTKNYLDVKLAKGETSKEKKYRLLPIDKDANTPFTTIHMHTIKLKPNQIQNGGSEWKSFVCLRKTEGLDESLGHKCPFCEAAKDAYDKSVAAPKDSPEQKYWHDLYSMYKAKPTCVVRGIERGNEKDGPKFLKFTLRKDGKDLHGDMIALYKTRKQESIDEAMDENGGVLPEGFVPYNIFDLDNGKDLKITISAVVDDKGKQKTAMKVVDYGKEKPLSTDPEEMEKWINDSKVWSDVFVAKPYEYGSIILDGNRPFFDQGLQKWVSRQEKEEQAEAANSIAETVVKEAERRALNAAQTQTPASKPAPSLTYDPDDEEDLPM